MQLETAHLAATAQTSGSKTWRWGEGANKNGYIVTVTPKEVGLERWGTVDPKIVTARAMEKAALKMGITNDPAKAKEIVGKMTINGLTTGSGENQRMVKATDFAYKGWMQDRVDSFGNYAVQMRPEDVANLISSAQEVSWARISNRRRMFLNRSSARWASQLRAAQEAWRLRLPCAAHRSFCRSSARLPRPL